MGSQRARAAFRLGLPNLAAFHASIIYIRTYAGYFCALTVTLATFFILDHHRRVMPDFAEHGDRHSVRVGLLEMYQRVLRIDLERFLAQLAPMFVFIVVIRAHDHIVAVFAELHYIYTYV
jgi:hypothetical protein